LEFKSRTVPGIFLKMFRNGPGYVPVQPCEREIEDPFHSDVRRREVSKGDNKRKERCHNHERTDSHVLTTFCLDEKETTR